MAARIVAALLLLGLVAPTAATADVSGPEIVSYLNAQRAAHGIPAGIVEDPALSDGCRKHNAYSAQNNELGHSEDPAKPGYTPEGDEAAKTSVLYQGAGPWTATNNPFETAPIHLHQLLAPRTDRMGASENDGYGCATTQGSRNRPAPPAAVTYTYPGNGAKNWAVAQTADEFPYTPGQQAGLPAGATTGPYLYVMFDGPTLFGFEAADNAQASLTGPAGPVDVVVVDNTTPGLEAYLPTGAEIIPRSPLAPATTYTARIAATVEGAPFAHEWQFTTGGNSLPEGDPFKAKARRRGGKIVVRVTALADLSAKVKVGGIKRSKALKAGATWVIRFPAPASPVKVRVVVTAAGERYVFRDKR